MLFVMIVAALFIYIGLYHSFFFMLPGVIILLVAIVGLWVMISSLWEKNTDEELDKFLDEDFDKVLTDKEEKEKLVLRPKKESSSLDHIAQKKPYKEKAVLRKSPKLPDRFRQNNMKRKSKQPLRPQESQGLSLVLLAWQFISVLLFSTGLCSGAVHFFSLSEDARAFLQTEKFLVTRNDHIVCASSQRALIYELNGRFLRSWSFPKIERLLYLETNRQNHLSIIGIKKMYVYNLDGKLLREAKAPERPKSNPFPLLLAHHNEKVYRFYKFFRHRVVRIDPGNSKQEVLIAASFYETFASGMCTFFLLLSGFFLFVWTYSQTPDEEVQNEKQGYIEKQIQWKLWTFPIKSHLWLLVCGPVVAFIIATTLIWGFSLLTTQYFSNNLPSLFFLCSFLYWCRRDYQILQSVF